MGEARGRGVETPKPQLGGATWAWLAERTFRPMSRRPWQGHHHRPVHPKLSFLRSVKTPQPASLEPPKPPNSTTPVSPFHHLFLPSPPPRQLCIY